MDCTPLFKNALIASRELNTLDNKKINNVLLMLADEAELNSSFIIEENRKDLARMDTNDPRYDRLLLNEDRIKNISADIRNVAGLSSPVGKILYEYKKTNGMLIRKVAVPFGVIGVIYEARPNVTFDVFSLCLKSGNVSVLKGGSDAVSSNEAIVKIIKKVLAGSGLNKDMVTLLPSGREETTQMLNARGYVDLIIPRGSQALIDHVRSNASIPVIETGAGICHTYFDKSGDVEKGKNIVNNAKTRRVSVCNALDCLIVHEQRLGDLPFIVSLCKDSDVIIYADEKAHTALKGHYPDKLLEKADDHSFGTEFLSYKMAVKTVSSFDEAVDHISEFSSKHSEAIVAEDKDCLKEFSLKVDASSVYLNTSTAFTDGAEFGLGAEIGISTQKLHARGPMALEALTTHKWIVEGNGQIRK